MKKIAIILSVFVLIVSSCGQTTKKQAEMGNYNMQNFQDTLIIKHKRILNKSDSTWYSQSYSYYWLVGKDTLDFNLSITERKDGNLYLRLSHKEPILFTDALDKIDASFPLIKENFNLSKLISFQFMPPVFYVDLAKKLSSEYEQKFGRKIIIYKKLNEFLLESGLTSQLNYFLDPLNKKVKRYGLEKFHLIDKENYKEYLPNVDITEYPEFIINGMGMYVQLENQ